MRLFIFVKNIIALRTLDKRIIRFIWDECSDLPINRVSYGLNCGWFRWSSTFKIPLSITLTPHSCKKELWTTLSHEVGHYKDYKKHRNVYDNDDSRIRWERSAWKWAMRFAKKYKFEIDYRSALFSLNTYGTTYRCLEKKAGITYKEIQRQTMQETKKNLQEDINKYKIEVRADGPNLYVDLTIPVPNYKGN